MADRPTVSVVVPTCRRPHVVGRAVRSALGQTFQDLEVIVVIDGPDPKTERILRSVADPRLRILPQRETRRTPGARNVGVAAARGEWIAFLDDDDEWMREKIALQLEAARSSSHAFPVVSCRLVARTPKGDFIWPTRLPRPGEPIGDYMLRRNGLFTGEGLLQASTLFTRKRLLERVPLRTCAYFHEDMDWCLQVSQEPGVDFVVLPTPLATWYFEWGKDTLSSVPTWEMSLEWLETVRHLVSPRAYAGFLMTMVTARAAEQPDWRGLRAAVSRALRHGHPRPIDFLLCAGIWVLPRHVRGTLRAWAQAVRLPVKDTAAGS